MPKNNEWKSWIFVSHASADLANVRRVRNLLEERGASPLLFHLMALEDPDEFWPIIEREIRARNFFLYCESNAAELSSWVSKERSAVEKARLEYPKSIGTIRVDGPEIDEHAIDEFLARTRVFPSFTHRERARVAPFLSALRLAGFAVFEDNKEIPTGVDWGYYIDLELRRTAESGWVVAFISRSSLQSLYVRKEIEHALLLGAKFVPVLLEPVTLPSNLSMIRGFDAYSSPAGAPVALANLLLERKRH
jgi:hypothetical protein